MLITPQRLTQHAQLLARESLRLRSLGDPRWADALRAWALDQWAQARCLTLTGKLFDISKRPRHRPTYLRKD
jgi:hypothetical protein